MMLKIDILSLFPEMFSGPFNSSILRRAQDKKALQIKVHDLRHWTTDRRGTVDDRTYGGGTGMILMVEPIDKALTSLKSKNSHIVLLDPAGKVFNQKIALQLAQQKHLILICGHYEGVDQRVKDHLVDESISIGDYVLTGGELPAMVLVDAISRLLPGVLRQTTSTTDESFSNNLLEYPQYTRPKTYKHWRVPAILLSGHHALIEHWRNLKSHARTKKDRPDLL